MGRLLVILVLVVACATLDTAETFVSDHGTVYACDSGAACAGGEEWCWDGSPAELEKLLGASCEVTHRWWPELAGCAYHCDGGRGCDAHCGCFCPPEQEQ